MFIPSPSTRIFLFGLLTGIVIASVGASGILRIVDRGVDYVRSHSTELAK